MNTETRPGGIASPDEQRPDPMAPSTERPPSGIPVPHDPPPAYPYPVEPDSHMFRGYQRPESPHHIRWGAWAIGGVIGLLTLGCMLTALLIAVLSGVLFSAVTGPETTVSATRAFVVSGTPSLVITDSAGNVTVRARSDSQVTAQVMKHAWGRTKAISQANADRMSVDLSQSGNTITMTARFDTTSFNGGTVRRTADLLVTVPQSANVSLQLGAGNIDIRGPSGEMQLVDGAGNVTADNVAFSGTSQLKTGAGNVTADCALTGGSTMDVNVGAGNASLTLPVDTPTHLDASTGLGNLSVDGWRIAYHRGGTSASHMDGDLNPHPTATLTAHVGTGNLTIISR